MLTNITVGSNQRGQCEICHLKSYRYSKWLHVQMWYDNHKCVDGRKTSRNGSQNKENVLLEAQ